MSEALLRTEPISAAPFTGADVTIGLAAPMARYSLRARHAQALEDMLGPGIPCRIGSTAGDVTCLGPDEWLLCAPAGTTIARGEGQAVSITDVSERAVRLMVEGSRAAETLMAGCPLDLDRLAVGRGTRTLFETVEIIVLRKHDHVFAVEVWRSFAPWLRLALEHAARQLR